MAPNIAATAATIIARSAAHIAPYAALQATMMPHIAASYEPQFIAQAVLIAANSIARKAIISTFMLQ